MYIIPKIKKINGGIDIKSIQDRYHNPEILDMYINKAKKKFENLSYRNERAMKFEVFNNKFQNTVIILDSYGRTMHNEDVVDLLWAKFNNAELAMFVASIKVDYCCNRQKYTNILKEIAIQISTGKNTSFITAGV